MKDPRVSITLDTARQVCAAKGAGWHLMTIAEWAAIALWCRKNGTMPKGNNNYGKDISETNLPQKAIPASKDSNGKIERVLTGSGRENWYHDETFAGIADLNGNVWEWNNGLMLNNGEILIIANNNAAANSTDVSETSTEWKAVMPDGTLVTPGTTGSLKYDIQSNKNVVSTSVSNSQYSGITTPFGSLTAYGNIDIPEILKALTLFPTDTNDTTWNSLTISNSGLVISCLGGGLHTSQTGAGIFCKHLGSHSKAGNDIIGFRSAYYGIV